MRRELGQRCCARSFLPAGFFLGRRLRSALSLADKLRLSSRSEKSICAYRPQHLHPRNDEICNSRVADNFFRAIGSAVRQALASSLACSATFLIEVAFSFPSLSAHDRLEDPIKPQRKSDEKVSGIQRPKFPPRLRRR
jgi:hypothetical protein